MKLISRRVRGAMTQELTGLQFYNQRKSGEEENFFVFLSKHHASIVCSSSRLGRGVFLSLCGQARSVDGCFLCVQITCPRNHELPELTGQDTGFTSPLFYFGGHVSCSVAWFVAQHACLVLW